MATPTQMSGTAVLGYFASGHEAHSAINALIDAGFEPTEIGAAFLVGETNSANMSVAGEGNRRANVGGELRDELGTTQTGLPPHHSRATGAGADSDTSSIQYAALGGGAGTPFDGASRPGPIPGSDITHSGLPSELKSELPHDSDVRAGSAMNTAMTSAAGEREGTSTMRSGLNTHADPKMTATPLHEGGSTVHESWGDRLKHVFGGKDAHRSSILAKAGKDDLQAEMRRDAQDFGTGEGHLDLSTSSAHRYSQSAFEQSFSSYGIQSEHARHFSRSVGKSGAIVTVHTSARIGEAERIFEAHGGSVRAAETGDVNGNFADEGDVEVFGTIGRDYPGYLK